MPPAHSKTRPRPRRVLARLGDARSLGFRGGRVGILDAFAMARRIERRLPIEAGRDFNRDGAANRKDVDLAAMAAVRIDEGAAP